jgi:outer membrane protein TolC
MNIFKSKYIFRLLFLALILVVVKLPAQEKLQLNEAIVKGLENNFQVQIFKEYTKIAELNNNWGTVGRYPSINIGALSVNRYDNSPSNMNPDDRTGRYAYTVSPFVDVKWLLFNGFSVKMNKDKLNLLEIYSNGNSALVVENTIQAVILAYYRILLEEERLKVLVQVKDLSGDRYNYEMIRKEIGSAVTFEVLQAKNSFLSDSTNYLLQQLNVKNAYLNLNLLLGESAQNSFVLVDSFLVETNTYVLEDLMKKMMASNRTLRNQFVNQEILKKDIGIKKAGQWPTLSLNGGADYNNSRYFYNNASDADAYTFDYYANFSLSFNLFNGGNTKRAIEGARINENIGNIEIKEMSQKLSNYLLNQYDLYNIRKQLLNVAESNMESAELNMQIATDKYKNGSINSFNFRDVQMIYLNAAHRKLNAIYDLIDTHTELLRLTGGIITEE